MFECSLDIHQGSNKVLTSLVQVVIFVIFFPCVGMNSKNKFIFLLYRNVGIFTMSLRLKIFYIRYDDMIRCLSLRF